MKISRAKLWGKQGAVWRRLWTAEEIAALKRRGERLYKLFGLVIIALLLSGCRFWSAKTYNLNEFSMSDLGPGRIRFIEAKGSPRWAVWDVPAKAWMLRFPDTIDDKGRAVAHFEFYPLSYSGDLLQEFSGPLSGVVDHVVPAVPIP